MCKHVNYQKCYHNQRNILIPGVKVFGNPVLCRRQTLFSENRPVAVDLATKLPYVLNYHITSDDLKSPDVCESQFYDKEKGRGRVHSNDKGFVQILKL